MVVDEEVVVELLEVVELLVVVEDEVVVEEEVSVELLVVVDDEVVVELATWDTNNELSMQYVEYRHSL